MSYLELLRPPVVLFVNSQQYLETAWKSACQLGLYSYLYISLIILAKWTCEPQKSDTKKKYKTINERIYNDKNNNKL